MSSKMPCKSVQQSNLYKYVVIIIRTSVIELLTYLTWQSNNPEALTTVSHTVNMALLHVFACTES